MAITYPARSAHVADWKRFTPCPHYWSSPAVLSVVLVKKLLSYVGNRCATGTYRVPIDSTSDCHDDRQSYEEADRSDDQCIILILEQHVEVGVERRDSATNDHSSDGSVQNGKRVG